jgi:aryl-alcohol dehydrogenase-like predicted oxidoreductase
MQLVLGTVQFGLRYGVAGRETAVPEAEVRALLARAWTLGVRELDTAAAYGDIEQRLVGLAEGLPFRIVTKLPPLPSGMQPPAAADWAESMLERSRTRLGAHLHAVLFHRAEDLLDASAEALWRRCAEWVGRQGVLLGASAYEPDTVARLQAQFALQIAQLPGNALDQRLAMLPAPAASSMQIHVRSAFLQGLLLMDRRVAAKRVPAAAVALAHWHAWAAEHRLDPLHAALGLAKGLPGVTHCVVGVDDLPQLEAIGAAWAEAMPLHAAELAVTDLDVIDPRRWPPRA